ncbi:hypothetical protein ABK040_002165 [Willaertia magna]
MADSSNHYTLLSTNHSIVPHLPQETLDRLFEVFQIKYRNIDKIFESLEIDKSTNITTMNVEQLNIQIKAIVANLPHTSATNLSGNNFFEEGNSNLTNISGKTFEEENILKNKEGFKDELYKTQEKRIKVESGTKKNSPVETVKNYEMSLNECSSVNKKLQELKQRLQELEKRTTALEKVFKEERQKTKKLERIFRMNCLQKELSKTFPG